MIHLQQLTVAYEVDLHALCLLDVLTVGDRLPGEGELKRDARLERDEIYTPEPADDTQKALSQSAFTERDAGKRRSREQSQALRQPVGARERGGAHAMVLLRAVRPPLDSAVSRAVYHSIILL